MDRKLPINIKNKLRTLIKLENQTRDLTDEICSWFESKGIDIDRLYANNISEESQIETMAYIANAEVSDEDIEDTIEQIEEFYINYK